MPVLHNTIPPEHPNSCQTQPGVAESVNDERTAVHCHRQDEGASGGGPLQCTIIAVHQKKYLPTDLWLFSLQVPAQYCDSCSLGGLFDFSNLNLLL